MNKTILIVLATLAFSLCACAQDVTLKIPIADQKARSTVPSELVLGNPAAQTIQGSGYYTLNSGSTNIGTGTTFYVLSLAHRTRIRQSGKIKQIKFYLPSKPGSLTAFYFSVWRKNGSNYDRIGQQEILASMTGGQENTISITATIMAKEGDYIGYGYTASSDPGNFLNGVTLSSSGRYVTSTPSQNNYNWGAGTSLGQYWPVNTYTEAPVIVGIGNSIMAGHPAHDSYIEQSTTPDAVTTSIMYKIGQTLGVPVQNMGIGSQGTTTIKNRFAADVVALNPKYVIIEGGVNDIANSTSNSTIESNITTMITDAITANITPVLVLVLPWTNGTTAQNQQADALNTNLAALVSTYPKLIIVDARASVGQFRSGGDAGNLWDIQSAYNADGVHFNNAGHQVIADKIVERILAVNGTNQILGSLYVKGAAKLATVAAATTDTDKFLVDDNGTVKYRTGTQLLSDIGLTDGDKGDITTASNFTSMTIDNDAVTYAKIQNVANNNRILGRVSGAAGDIEELTASQVNTLLGTFTNPMTTQGDLIVGGTSGAATRLAKGTAGHFLRVNGAGTDLEYAAITGGGDALVSNPLSQFAATSSAQLAGVLSDETGTGLAVYNTNPTLSGTITTSGTTLYQTTATGQGVLPSSMYAVVESDHTLNNDANLQSAFPSAYDTYTLAGSTTYEFEGMYNLSTGTTSASLIMAFSLGGGASITSIRYNTLSWSANIGSLQSSVRVADIESVSATSVAVAAAIDGKHVTFKGILRMNAGGTVTPQVQFGAAPGGTNIMKKDSYIKFTPIGSNTVSSVGPIN